MRSARASDVWRDALKHKKGSYHVEKVVLKNVRGLGDKEISFASRFNALCGENGVGKTSLLKAIFVGLAPVTARFAGIELRPQILDQDVLVSSVVAVSEIGVGKGNRTTYRTENPEIYAKLGDGGDDCVVSYLDPASIAQRSSYQIINDSDFGTALEGVPQKFDSDELLALRSEITGRKYSSVTTFEIEDYSTFPTFPYFKVKVGTTEYSSEDMGLGELCVNILVWALDRLRSDSIVLLEEPESHLPPRAQERLMTYIAELVVQRNLNVILSTHSQHTLENFPSEQITFLGRLIDKSVVHQNPSMSMLYDSLRISRPSLCVVAVEDHSAFAFFETLISEFDVKLLERIDFVWRNGWASVDRILESVPRNDYARVKFIGVYDGDQRDTTRPGSPWRYLYLPGGGDPAEYMVDSVRNNVEEFASMIGHVEAEVLLGVANLGTVDVKEFFPRLSKALRKNVHPLYIAGTVLWLRTPLNWTESQKIVNNLRELMLPK